MLDQSPTELLRRFFNSRFWQYLKPMLILTVVAIGGLFVGVRVVIPQLENQLTGAGSIKSTTSASGEVRYLYKDGTEPKSYSDELTADPAQLIARNWESRQQESPGANEDAPGIAVPRRDRAELLKATNAFLSRWETFSAAASREAYRQSLVPYVDLASLESISRRSDSLQSKQIRPGGSSGSRWLPDSIGPNQTLEFLRYSDNNAYLNTMGSVKLTGPAMIFNGRELRRSYGIVFRRIEGRWKVVRVAAQTLGDTVQ